MIKKRPVRKTGRFCLSTKQFFQRSRQPLLKELHHNAGTKYSNDRAFSRTDDMEMEEQQGQQYGKNHTANIKGDLYIAKVSVAFFRQCLDKSFTRIHNNVCNDRQRNTKCQHNCANENHCQTNRVCVYSEKGEKPNAKVREPTKEKGKRNLQQLNPLEAFSKQ